MGKYIVEIEGKHPLDQINLQIAREEAAASKLVQSTIAVYNGRDTNLVELEELPSGTRPKTLTLVTRGSAQPTGTSEVWSGPMLVQNKRQDIIAYREM